MREGGSGVARQATASGQHVTALVKAACPSMPLCYAGWLCLCPHCMVGVHLHAQLSTL